LHTTVELRYLNCTNGHTTHNHPGQFADVHIKVNHVVLRTASMLVAVLKHAFARVRVVLEYHTIVHEGVLFVSVLFVNQIISVLTERDVKIL